MKLDAVRCGHCRAALIPGKPTHKGTCFYCKERIQRDAVRCKHCGSYVGPGHGYLSGGDPEDDDCGCFDASKKFTVTDVTSPPPPGSVELPFDVTVGGKALAPQAGCSECESSGGGLIFNGGFTHKRGTRRCWVRIPIKLNPDGTVHTYKQIEWTEDCAGDLVNDPWA